MSDRVQSGLQRFAKPWWRRRELQVFRDRTGLTADPGLWTSIATAMDASRYFLLLAAPQAAASPWVAREIEHWTAEHGSGQLLLLLTDGEIVWDDATGDFDWPRSSALPPALAGLFAEEPRWVDMRWARSDNQLDLTNGRFRDQIAELSAPVHGVRKDDIAGEHVRQHRRTMRTVWAASIALLLLSVASVVGTVLAVTSANQARTNEQRALAQQRRADSEAQIVNSTNDALAKANTSLSRSLDNLAAKNTELVSQTALTDKQRRIASKNAVTATKNAQTAIRNLALATANEKTAKHNAAVAEVERQAAQTNEVRALSAENTAIQTAAALHVSNANLKTSIFHLVKSNAAGLSRQLAAQSLVQINNLDRAMLLGVAAWKTSPTAAARSALMQLSESSVGVEGFLRPPGVTPDSPNAQPGAVATSSDGTRRAEAQTNGEIIVWEGAHARSGQMIAQIPSGLAVSGMTFSADGRDLVAWDTLHHVMKSWDLSDPRRSHVRPMDCPSQNKRCGPLVAPNGQLILAAAHDVSFIDPASLNAVVHPGTLGTHGNGNRGSCLPPATSDGQPLSPSSGQTETCLSPGNARYAIGFNASGAAVLWDRFHSAAEIVLHSGATNLELPAVSDDERFAAAVSPGTGVVHIFDSATGIETHSVSMPAPPAAIAIAPRGASVAAIDAAGSLSIRMVATGAPLADASLTPADPARVEYSANGHWVAVSDGTRVQVVQAGTGRVAADLRASGYAIDGSANGHLIARLDASRLLIWDLKTDSPAAATTDPGGFGQSAIRISPDRHTVAALSSDHGVMLFPLDDLTGPQRSLPGSDSLTAFSFGTSTRIVGVEGNGTLIEWNLNANAVGTTLLANRAANCGSCQQCNACPMLAVSPDGTAVASAVTNSGTGSLTIERPIGSGTPALLAQFPGQAERLTFTPDGQSVVVVYPTGTLVVSAAGGIPHTRPALGLVAFSADGSTAASIDAHARTVTLWTLPDLTPRGILHLDPLVGDLVRIALDRTGARLVALDASGTVSFWDVDGGLEIRHWTIPDATPFSSISLSTVGGKIAVFTEGRAGAQGKTWILSSASPTPIGDVGAGRPAVAFSPTGDVFATAGPDVQLWNTRTLEPIGDALPFTLPAIDPSNPLGGLTANVLQFTSNGHEVLVMTPDKKSHVDVRSVNIDPQTLADDACAVANRKLTADERQQFDIAPSSNDVCSG